MSLDVRVGGTVIPTDISALKSFEDHLRLAFELDTTLSTLLDSTLSSVPQTAASSSIAYTSPPLSWSPGAGPVTFGLQSGASGTLTILSSGDLVSYTDGLESPQKGTIPLPAGAAYISLALNFNISANATGQYSGGAYGAKAALNTTDSYTITFFKAFTPATLVRNAVAQVFESFVLPLHPETLNQMSAGGYLLHQFDGNVHLSFGAYAGLDKVLYAGQGAADVLKTFGTPLATLSGGTAPEVNASVSLDFAFAYAANFEALLSKGAGTARLHLFRSSKKQTSITLNAGLNFDSGTTAAITTHTDVIESTLVNAAGGADSPGGAALGKVLAAGEAEIQKYVGEVNDKLTSWVNRADGQTTSLQVAIETNNDRTILAGYDFDLSSPQFAKAWRAASDGDFVKALATGAVTLDAGSGLEHAYRGKTTFNCNFFNLWSMTEWSEFSSKVTLVYAGNNVFHLVANVGRSFETQTIGAMRSMNFYFTAMANASIAGTISNAVVDLHIDLTAQGDPKGASAIAGMMRQVQPDSAGATLARDMQLFATNSKSGTAQLQVTISAAGYANISCDAYVAGKPAASGTANDAQNWMAFAQAADDLKAWPLLEMSAVSQQALTLFKSFAGWQQLNVAATGSSLANRLQMGNTMNQWPQSFPPVDAGVRPLIVYSMLAAQSFMNLCAALHELASETDPSLSKTSVTNTSWTSLIGTITDAVKHDVELDFVRTTALALIRLCKPQSTKLAGPPTTALPKDHFAVSLRM